MFSRICIRSLFLRPLDSRVRGNDVLCFIVKRCCLRNIPWFRHGNFHLIDSFHPRLSQRHNNFCGGQVRRPGRGCGCGCGCSRVFFFFGRIHIFKRFAEKIGYFFESFPIGSAQACFPGRPLLWSNAKRVRALLRTAWSGEFVFSALADSGGDVIAKCLWHFAHSGSPVGKKKRSDAAFVAGQQVPTQEPRHTRHPRTPPQRLQGGPDVVCVSW